MTSRPLVRNESDRVSLVTVSAAEILALHTTPKELVPAQGPNTLIVPKLMFLYLDYNSVAYANVASGDDFAVRYTNGSGQFILGAESLTSAFLTATADELRMCPIFSPLLPDIKPVPNAAIVLALAGAVTDGNSPIRVETHYDVYNLNSLITGL